MYKNIKELIKKNKKNSAKFTPEIKISANQVEKIKIVCPKSGWEISNIIIGKITKKLKKYFKYRLIFSFKLKVDAMITIIKGFKSSIGWNLGKKSRSTHLFDPLTSTPINGTRNKAIKQIIKNTFDTKNKFFKLKYERKNTIEIPKIT